MTQQMPNPIELYEAAAQGFRQALSAVKDDQMNSATPCALWNVQALINHNVDTTEFVRGAPLENIKDRENQRTFSANYASRVACPVGVFEHEYTSGRESPRIAVAGGNLIIAFDRTEHLQPWSRMWSVTGPSGRSADPQAFRSRHEGSNV